MCKYDKVGPMIPSAQDSQKGGVGIKGIGVEVATDDTGDTRLGGGREGRSSTREIEDPGRRGQQRNQIPGDLWGWDPGERWGFTSTGRKRSFSKARGGEAWGGVRSGCRSESSSLLMPG